MEAYIPRSAYRETLKEGNTLRYLPREIRDMIYEIASWPGDEIRGFINYITIPDTIQGMIETPFYVPKWCSINQQFRDESTPCFIGTCHFVMHSIEALHNLTRWLETFQTDEVFLSIRELTFSWFSFEKSTWPLALDLIRRCKGLKYLDAQFNLQDLFHNRHEKPIPRSLVDIVEIFRLDEVLDLENLLILELSADNSGHQDKEYRIRKKIWREVEWWVNDELKKRKKNREFGLFTGKYLFDSPNLPDERKKIGWEKKEMEVGEMEVD